MSVLTLSLITLSALTSLGRPEVGDVPNDNCNVVCQLGNRVSHTNT